ncbi:sugar ABC transporter permease [Ktedonobacteria bacterium brp13]|nr:sugar ABC transporter permease [Ktedonobacteria bacterium brp13]
MASQVVETVPENEKPPTLLARIRTESGFLPYILVLPTILLILVVAVYPILNSVYLSFISDPLGATGGAFAGFANYVAAWNDSAFRTSFGTTIVFGIISVILETFFGMLIALLINQAFPGRGLVRAAILVPWAFPTIVSAYMWLLMYNDQTGIVSYILQGLHLLAPGSSLIQSTSGVIIASIITDVWKTTPFMTLLILAGLQVIPGELYEAAHVDGCSRWQQFWRMTMPMLRNTLLIALLFRSLDAIRVFDLFYAFGKRSVPSMASQADFNMFAGTNADFAPGIAEAVIVFALGLVISIIFVSMMRGVFKDND